MCPPSLPSLFPPDVISPALAFVLDIMLADGREGTVGRTWWPRVRKCFSQGVAPSTCLTFLGLPAECPLPVGTGGFSL